jgi:hypothetical protein
MRWELNAVSNFLFGSAGSATIAYATPMTLVTICGTSIKIRCAKGWLGTQESIVGHRRLAYTQWIQSPRG